MPADGSSWQRCGSLESSTFLATRDVRVIGTHAGRVWRSGGDPAMDERAPGRTGAAAHPREPADVPVPIRRKGRRIGNDVGDLVSAIRTLRQCDFG